MAVKHPGIGTDVAERLGREGVAAVLRLKTPQVIQLHRISPQLSHLAADRKKPVMDMLTKAPKAILSLLEKHPRVLLTTAGVTTPINYWDTILGGEEMVEGPDGQYRIMEKPGILERAMPRILDSDSVQTGIVVVAGAAGVIIFLRELVSIGFAIHRKKWKSQ